MRQQGKASAIYGWYNNSTIDVEQIRKWWTKTPMPISEFLQVRNRLAGA